MSDILNKTIVLVLNRNWQAIHVRTPQEAFCMMATNVATALEIDGDDHIRPVTWDEWIRLPVRPQDNAVQTVRGQIRVPTVIVVSGPFVGARLCLQDQPQRFSVCEVFGPQECCGWCACTQPRSEK